MNRLFIFISILMVSCANSNNETKSINKLEHELDSLKKEKEIINAIESMDTIERDFSYNDEDPIIRTRKQKPPTIK